MLVAVGLFMWPMKEVKAQQQQEFAPPLLIKTTWVYTYYDVENPYSYEFVVTYKLDGIFINNLNRFEYFLVTRYYMGIGQGVLDRSANSMRIEEILIEDNSTIFYVRMTLGKAAVNNYYSGIESFLENIEEFFVNDSAFYVWVMYEDVAGQAYNAGYNDGWNSGYEYGRDEGLDIGYFNGYEDGYNSGYENGFENGIEAGYDEGYINGRDDGYNNGYNVGYNDGIDAGYNEGYEKGKEDGFEEGFNASREHWYNVGYQVGYNKGLNEQIADRDFSHLLRSAFVAIGTFLGINLLPGISIGAIIAVPIVFGIIAFILGKRKD